MFCSKVKEYLSQKGVKYTERNVSKDAGAIADLRKLGIMTLPLTLVNGEAVTGFNQQRLEELFGSGK